MLLEEIITNGKSRQNTENQLENIRNNMNIVKALLQAIDIFRDEDNGIQHDSVILEPLKPYFKQLGLDLDPKAKEMENYKSINALGFWQRGLDSFKNEYNINYYTVSNAMILLQRIIHEQHKNDVITKDIIYEALRKIAELSQQRKEYEAIEKMLQNEEAFNKLAQIIIDSAEMPKTATKVPCKTSLLHYFDCEVKSILKDIANGKKASCILFTIKLICINFLF